MRRIAWRDVVVVGAAALTGVVVTAQLAGGATTRADATSTTKVQELDGGRAAGQFRVLGQVAQG
jgi:hypothetical protein